MITKWSDGKFRDSRDDPNREPWRKQINEVVAAMRERDEQDARVLNQELRAMTERYSVKVKTAHA